MDRSLHEPDAQGFIPFIHNYCDRRCERCRFVRQCRVGAVDVDDVGEAEDAIASESPEDLRKRLMKLMGLSEEDMAALDTEEPAVDEEEQAEEAAAMEAYRAEADALDKRVDAHELSRLAMAYMDLVHTWIRQREERFEARGIQLHPRQGLAIPVDLRTADALVLSEAVQEILWFHTLLPAKISRALHGRLGEHAVDDPVQSDHNGTAKVCIDAVRRSLAGWDTLTTLMPQEADAAVPMQESLRRMQVALHREFPRAMDFIRPGFDAPHEPA